MVDAVSAAEGGGTGAHGVAVSARAYLDALVAIAQLSQSPWASAHPNFVLVSLI